MKVNSTILSALLLFGIVDQIYDDVVVIEYEKSGKIMHTNVSLSQSACVPVEGQRVYFFEDYKIVTCEDNK